MTERFGWSHLTGGYLIAVVAFGAAALGYAVLLRPDPSDLAYDQAPETLPDQSSPAGVRAYLGERVVRQAFLILATGQVVMVLIMSMTPLHLHEHGQGLGTIGFIFSTHTFGMFAFSPLVGRAVERFGAMPIIGVGLATLFVAAALASAAAQGGLPLVGTSMFLLGIGWNCGFVAGSALLTSGIPPLARPRVQGLADAVAWASAATASVCASLLMASLGYRTLCFVGMALVAIPAITLVSTRRRPVPPSP